MSLKRLVTFSVAASAVALLTAACGGAPPEPGPAAGQSSAKRVDESAAGTLTGRVSFEGPEPRTPPLKVASDPVCMQAHKDGIRSEAVLVSDGGLENVFVYIKDGLGDYHFDIPTEPVTLDQKGCRYEPHVFGARVGQPIEITNGDSTMHNVHALPNVNQEFNFAQAVQGITDVKTFTAREVMVPFKCDLHPWMSAYAGVLEHPYFAVTSAGGRFEIPKLPPGTYTVEAWHEKLGTKFQSITIGPKESTSVDFAFDQTSNPRSGT